jgi:predicted CopG family antitoxin
MQKKLTITINKDIYNKLYEVVGHGYISHFIETTIRPYLVKENLEAAYQQMARDETREAEALEWAEATIGDVSYETR